MATPIHPDATTIVVAIGAVATNTGTTGTNATFNVMPYAQNNGEVLEVYYVNGAAITGSASTYSTLELRVGVATTGTVIASRAMNSTPTNDLVAHTQWALTMSATATAAKFSRGDSLVFVKKDVGASGLALTAPNFVQITYLSGAQAH